MISINFSALLKQLLFIGMLLSISITMAIAQPRSAQIQGRVTDLHGKGLPDINIRLEGRNDPFSSNVSGQFRITDLRPGRYMIYFSGIGYKRLKQVLDIEAGKQQELTVVLAVEELGLQQVEILGRKGNSYKSDYTFGATKTATYLKDVPQAVSIVTKELMADRQVTKAWEVTKMMSGVNRYSNYNDIVIRGFRSGENQPRLINGLRAAFGYFDQPVTANLERVEVIKGPSSLWALR